MLDAYEELSREYSENHLDVLFQYNPARICDNREILRLEPSRIPDGNSYINNKGEEL